MWLFFYELQQIIKDEFMWVRENSVQQHMKEFFPLRFFTEGIMDTVTHVVKEIMIDLTLPSLEYGWLMQLSSKFVLMQSLRVIAHSFVHYAVACFQSGLNMLMLNQLSQHLTWLEK